MVIVAGGGIGVTALLAANENCHVVAMEPTYVTNPNYTFLYFSLLMMIYLFSPENSFRMAQAILANEMEDRLTIIDIALDTKWSKVSDDHSENCMTWLFSLLTNYLHAGNLFFPKNEFAPVGKRLPSERLY